MDRESIEHEQCDACGFDGRRYRDAALIDAVRALGPTWRALIGASGPELRVRPAPDVWSALEYAAHSRDITALHVFGVQQALTRDEPTFGDVAADELIQSAAVSYGSADPDEVVDALEAEATHLALLADTAGTPAWTRGVTIGDGRRDVRRLLEHALHDSLHHVADVERGLTALRMA
jgi:hypothetical protein